MSVPAVQVYGIRHHGPGSARSLVAALDEFHPDVVLIEGPADADPLVPWAGSERTEPPVALLAYVADEPSRAAFWPFAVFSPEWQALQWAIRERVPARFCDLPATHSLARSSSRASGSSYRSDPLARLAEAAGYDDPERWWDDVVETRRDSTSIFVELIEAMAAIRAEVPTSADGPSAPDEHEARREAHMRQTIRGAGKAGHQRIAVVCGAWHAPVLTAPLPPAGPDVQLLRGMPRQKVHLTWVPWTHARLSTASGYGAGVTSPGWYAHLWSAPDQPVTRWLAKVAGALRGKDLATSTASVIESVRLAETLAALRRRPLAGLSEVQDATRAVLCDGSAVLLDFVSSELVVGQALGAVDPDVPTVPLEADLINQCRRLRIRREAAPRRHDLDLRKPSDRSRSVLFHRLRVLELGWIRPVESEVAHRGTFRETWQSQWHPEYAVSLVEASTWGTTVETAATAKIIDAAGSAGLVEQTAAVERCLPADLPEALSQLLAAVAEQAALDSDVVHVMEALPPLARAQRYGDVRGTDTATLRKVSETLVVRICAALKPALAGLDAEAARAMRQRIDAVHLAVDLLDDAESATGGPTAAQRWLDTLAAVLQTSGAQPEIAGRVLRILFDAERLHDPQVRLHRALSYGAPAAEKAAWIEGFFADGALLLIHDAGLRELVDGWLAELSGEEFVDVLPLVRRTFGAFSPAERRMIAERLHRQPQPAGTVIDPVAEELVGPAVAAVDAILGGSR